MNNFDLQKKLNSLGFNAGKVDGVFGPSTRRAVIEFQKSKGLVADGIAGPMTKAALLEGIVAAPKKMVGPRKSLVGMPEWLRFAYSFLGLKEIPGKRHNQKIVGWWESLGLHFRDDETPWCAGFANRMVQLCGLPIPKKYRAAALGWVWNGYGTELPGPALGAFMIMTRPGRAGSGHITIVAGKNRKGQIMGLGGNQGNMVQINPYHPTARKARYFWPQGAALPKSHGMKTLPVITSGGAKLVNEG